MDKKSICYKILVIVVTFNGAKWLKRCVESVVNSSVSASLYVVDNGSKDNSVEIVKENCKEAIVVESNENLGFGKANNIGLKFAIENGYDYVYLLNQDAWLEEGTLECLVNTITKYPEYGILSPIQLQASGQKFDTNFVLGPCSTKYNPQLVEDLFFKRVKDVYPVQDVMAAHWMMSISCVKDVGGFSPIFPQYGEDNNYIDRVIYRGYKVGIVPQTTAIHDRSTRSMSKDKYYYINCFINTLVVLSDPQPHQSKITSILGFAYLCISKYGSIIPITKYYYKVLMSLYRINKYKKLSLVKGAFLN